MAGLAADIRSHRFAPADNLFLDANVWMLLYGPQYSPCDRRVRVYSAALKDILAAGCHLFLDALVLSEFVNRYARYEYDVQPPTKKPRTFKDFRNSSSFKPSARHIAAECERILKLCRCVESGFSALDADALLTTYAAGQTDINDQIMAELCRTQGWTFVTDDADFKGVIPLLTANGHLLKP